VALQPLLPLQRGDFVEMLEAMDGLPVVVRLIDPPLHEFLPDFTELSVRVALERVRHEENEDDERLLAAVRRLHEQNPMLGLRGVRLGIMIPGLIALQVRALAEAAAMRIKAGGHPVIEVMVPVVDSANELEIVREETEEVLDTVAREQGVALDHIIGTMIELPRACLTAGHIAQFADFFSFGTNDLTQTTWGFSRDDVEASFFHRYLESGIFAVSPFESIDRRGVGRLIEMAVKEGRDVRPDLEIGVCGEHGGDPDSIHFFHEASLDYVSCSPFRVPVARLEAGRAAVSGPGSDTR
jgi:pyruvate,orthophosphate dikinase